MIIYYSFKLLFKVLSCLIVYRGRRRVFGVFGELAPTFSGGWQGWRYAPRPALQDPVLKQGGAVGGTMGLDQMFSAWHPLLA